MADGMGLLGNDDCQYAFSSDVEAYYNTIVPLAPVTKAPHWPPPTTTTCKTVIAATSKWEKG